VGHPLTVAVRIEEAQHALGLLKGLDQSVKQNAVEATVAEFDAILVMLVKGVHGNLQCWLDTWKITPVNAFSLCRNDLPPEAFAI
jgi:hypothetical protein